MSSTTAKELSKLKFVMVAVVRDCSKKILKKKHYFQGIPRLYNFEGTNAKNIKDVIFR
jgi:hypothetical protein